MAGHHAHNGVGGGFGLAVHAQRRRRFILAVDLPAAVEDVVRGHLDQGQSVLDGGAGQPGGGGDVDAPGGGPSFGVSASSTAV